MSSAADMIAAVRSGDLERVNQLLASEPSLALATDEGGASALMTAVYYGHPAIADVLAGGRAGQLNIFEATVIGNVDEVRRLLAHDPALLHAFSADGFNALQFAAYFGKREVVEVLLRAGADPNVASRNAMGVMPLHSAMAGGYIEIALLLLEHGADASAASAEGWTPLHYAADIGDAEIARVLIARGARGGVPNNSRLTAEELGEEAGHGHVSEVIRAGG